MSPIDKTIACIGGGHITGIIMDNLIKTKPVSADRVIISEPNQEQRRRLEQKFSVKTTSDNTEAVGAGDIIFINVRPQIVNAIVEELSHTPLPKGKVLVTLAAGILMEKYRKLGNERAVVRALPNPPSQVGRGIIAVVFNEFVSDIQRQEIMVLFDSMGQVVTMAEKHINAMTTLSSPVAPLLFFESLIKAGVQMGIDKDTAVKIAYQTIIGVMEVWNQRQVEPSLLVQEASTPGGISVETMASLEKYGFQAAIADAIQSGLRKAEQLGN